MVRYRYEDDKWVGYVPVEPEDFDRWNIDEPTDHDDDAQHFNLMDLLADD